MVNFYPKEQTAFRFDKDLLESMKMRARKLNKSLNGYITYLVMNDLKASRELPKISLPDTLDSSISRFCGIIPTPDATMLDADERLADIWNR